MDGDEKTPRKWRNGLFFKLPRKGNVKGCKNWRLITLLSVVGKVMGRIVIDRIRIGVESNLRKEQAGFRPGRGTTEQIFILRNIIAQSIESSLYVNFIDFEKAFDSVHRDSLWLIMRSSGIPSKIINMVKTLYDNFQCAVVDGQDTTEWFKQGGGLAATFDLAAYRKVMIAPVKKSVNHSKTKFLNWGDHANSDPGLAAGPPWV